MEYHRELLLKLWTKVAKLLAYFNSLLTFAFAFISFEEDDCKILVSFEQI